MKDYKLDKYARTYIGKLININDMNSPLLKSNKAFLERVGLYQPVYYIQNMIEIFLEESKKYTSTIGYIHFIESEKRKVLENIEKLLEDNTEIYKVGNRNLQESILKDEYIDTKFLEIKLDNKLLACINYLLTDKEHFDTIQEYISQYTKCEYLKNLNIDYNDLSEYYKVLVKLILYKIENKVISKAKKFISDKQLIAVSNGDITFVTHKDTRILSINSLHDELSNCDELKNIDFSINTYTIYKRHIDSEIYIKKYDIGYEEIIKANASELEFIDLMACLNNTRNNKNNLLFECNNITCRASKFLSLDWIL